MVVTGLTAPACAGCIIAPLMNDTFRVECCDTNKELWSMALRARLWLDLSINIIDCGSCEPRAKFGRRRFLLVRTPREKALVACCARGLELLNRSNTAIGNEQRGGVWRFVCDCGESTLETSVALSRQKTDVCKQKDRLRSLLSRCLKFCSRSDSSVPAE
jgi:hypothetical protein